MSNEELDHQFHHTSLAQEYVMNEDPRIRQKSRVIHCGREIGWAENILHGQIGKWLLAPGTFGWHDVVWQQWETSRPKSWEIRKCQFDPFANKSQFRHFKEI